MIFQVIHTGSEGVEWYYCSEKSDYINNCALDIYDEYISTFTTDSTPFVAGYSYKTD